MNCWSFPSATDGFVGVTWIDVSAAAVTVSVVVPLVVPCVAVITVVPVATDVARPCEPGAFETVAVAAVPEFHVTSAVRSCVDASVYVPVAVSCFVRPSGMLGFVGVTAIETSVAGVTVSAAVPLIVPSVAVIVVAPTAAAVARPREPAAFEIVAVATRLDDHVTCVVRSWVVRSVYVPIAVNCCVVPFAIDGATGVTAIETSAAVVTVSSAVPFTAPSVAVIVVVPFATPVARPLALIVAVAGVPEVHVTIAEMSCVDRSE